MPIRMSMKDSKILLVGIACLIVGGCFFIARYFLLQKGRPVMILVPSFIAGPRLQCKKESGCVSSSSCLVLEFDCEGKRLKGADLPVSDWSTEGLSNLKNCAVSRTKCWDSMCFSDPEIPPMGPSFVLDKDGAVVLRGICDVL